jgi:cyclopropane fatty-acyl-phospholipid synthase-like methyltransferase
MKLKYKTLVNCENGVWNTDNTKHHCQDKKLTKGLINFFKDNKATDIVDLGCGNGAYVKSFIDVGLIVKGFDGNPNTKQMTNGLCDVKDLSIPFTFYNKYDWVMSLEVGEHIPKKYEDNFIDNICNNCKTGLVLSWAVKGQGGSGHFNEQNNDYIKQKIIDRGFYNDENCEELLRSDCSLSWFRNTLMVFYRSG